MNKLSLHPPGNVATDLVTFGEVMAAFKPVNNDRVEFANQFNLCFGGGEFNVAYGLASTFGLRSAHVTSFVDTPLARNVFRQMRSGGVDLTHTKWLEYDGIGQGARLGLNFTENGSGLRGAVAVVDRGHTAASLIQPGDFDWNKIFGEAGARWYHTGGIAAALSATTAQTVIESFKAARAHGVVTSYDLNYRASLWKRHGGAARAKKVNREIMPYVDVLFGNEEDLTAALGYKVEGLGEHCDNVDTAAFRQTIGKVREDFPNLQVVATTLRTVHSATINDWGAIMYFDGDFHEATMRKGLEIFDRVGGGDSFCSGVIYGFLEGRSPKECVELGAAHGALVSTTPGDTSKATRSEVEALAKGSSSARVVR